jgi:IS5 family transposase
MLGRKERDQLELFITGSLRQLVPDDHILARVDRVLDLSWLRAEVKGLYGESNGRPGIDPEVAVRLMLAGFLVGIVHDRRLMREAHVNIAIRWFIGYGLHEALPDHSSLTRIRQRWGAERFRRIFQRTVKACMDAKIAKGEIVHVDASLIRADVSWDSLAARHADAVAEANENEAERAERTGRQSGRHKKICTTDPDASMATNGRNRRLEPAYKQHAVVDDVRGVVLDVAITTGEINEGQVIIERIDEAAATTGVPIKTVTADAGYSYAKVYAGLERRNVSAVIPTKAEPIRSAVPLRRFSYDAVNDILKCPRGKALRPARPVAHGRFFYSRARDCKHCDLASVCLSKGRVNKAVVVGDDYPALLRARRRRERWTQDERHLYQRHRWRSEGYHGEAKTWHGLARAVRRGLENMRIQAYLTAIAVNLKRLAAAFLATLHLLAAKASIVVLRTVARPIAIFHDGSRHAIAG